MVKARKYVAKKHFQGDPKRDDYELIEYELPPLKNGEVLVKAEWISVDPCQRAFNSQVKTPFDQFSAQVGVVLESKAPEFPVGCRIVSEKGWCDYSIVNPKEKSKVDWLRVYKLPNMGNLSPSLGVGTVGMTGATAYFGFLEICKPKAGETVVVTGAAGAVGSMVGQIAKIKGCRVIGFAGSDEKVKWLETELGFDKAINYKTANVVQALKDAAPKGVDCYYDNVGGEISSQIMSQMNSHGRVAVCGSISSYNESNMPKATIVQPSLVFKQLKVEGFIVSRWLDRWPEAFADIIKWIETGKLQARQHITEGFENLFDAFVGMLAGENCGKAVVKV
ncbi:prostaglandin reductase 1-like [Cydia strobilella]|uniref:prostaglandin reductase 1-like n=1 Tax=Cydia strobilella TaxID=1100964 RepID=UPI00300715ED